MRTQVVAVGAVIGVFLIPAALAPVLTGAEREDGSNLPAAACSNLEAFEQRPDVWDCPTPYVEMQPAPEGDDVAYDRVWLCSTTKAVIGMVKPSMGLDPGMCGGSGMKGWKLPDDALSLGVPLAVTSSGWTVPTDPYFALRSEVHHVVIMPCLRDAIADAPASARGLMTVDAAAEHFYIRTRRILDPFAENAVNHAKGMVTSDHAEFFALARELCYETVVEALF